MSDEIRFCRLATMVLSLFESHCFENPTSQPEIPPSNYLQISELGTYLRVLFHGYEIDSSQAHFVFGYGNSFAPCQGIVARNNNTRELSKRTFQAFAFGLVRSHHVPAQLSSPKLYVG